MIAKINTDAVLDQMKVLCTTLLEQEAYRELRSSIDRFAADSDAVKQYERFLDKHHTLQHKEDNELELEHDELEEYMKEEQALYDNASIRQFIHAQRELSNVHTLVSEYLMKTIELNRLPEPEEHQPKGCGCGGGCGNH
jgi:Protein of unknown function (DUF964).